MSDEEAKHQAARAALQYLPKSGVIGLGTGSTSELFVAEVAQLCRQGRDLVGVATSERTRHLAQSLGLKLLDDDGPWSIDVCVDGADEVSERLDVIKGGGASHAREKIVNRASRFNVIIVDESKLSPLLGTRFPLPVEVMPFGHASTALHLARFGAATLRTRQGTPVRTDGGNLVYDVRVAPIADPAELDRQLCIIPGVIETGLFVGRADVVLVGSKVGTRELKAG
jgi:ribose 5-phosphate isomerase A